MYEYWPPNREDTESGTTASNADHPELVRQSLLRPATRRAGTNSARARRVSLLQARGARGAARGPRLRRPQEARSPLQENEWRGCWRGGSENPQGESRQGESQISRPQDERDLVGSRSHGELAQEQAGRRREDRE